MKGRVLIIEDEREIADLIAIFLEKEGMTAEIAHSAEEGELRLREGAFDLITLDLNLPLRDGFEFLENLRPVNPAPVIVLSAREADNDVVQALSMGADDYISKPFRPDILIARIRAVLRRYRRADGRVDQETAYRFGPFKMMLQSYHLEREGERINLSPREFDILRHLVENREKVMSMEEIFEAVWGQSYGDINAVAVYIRRLRQKIEEDSVSPQYIRTVYGRGYCFFPQGEK